VSRRALLLVVLLAAIAALGTVAVGAPAQTERSGAPGPLWVPDPEDLAAAPDDAATPALEVSAPVTSDAGAAGDPSQIAIAHWMAGVARESGLPGELPVMASLVESGLRNLAYGDADSVGYFQMRQAVWNGGAYEGYLARPELQIRWFVDHALAVLNARRAAGDATYGDDPATWGEWIADIERPYEPYRGRYQLRLAEARALLALPAPNVAPFELGLTVGGLAAAPEDPVSDALAQQVLSDDQITLEARSTSDLVAGRVDPRVSAVLLEAAKLEPISLWVIQTGHSYYVAGTNRPSNHSFGRAVDIGSVGGELVSPTNEAAHRLALALGRLPIEIRPTEIGSPWAIGEPEYFTNAGHQDHLHVGFDDPAAADAAAAAAAATSTQLTAVPVAARRSSPSAEPRFDAGTADDVRRGDDPKFEVVK
jgi:hypothetical protein